MKGAAKSQVVARGGAVAACIAALNGSVSIADNQYLGQLLLPIETAIPIVAFDYSSLNMTDVESQAITSGEASPTDALAEEFNLRVKQWKEETLFHSSLSKKFTNPAYVRIMAMGKPALPWILSELQKNSGHWFYALKYIAGKDVAADAKTESFEEARAAWLQWGYNNNYIYHL